MESILLVILLFVELWKFPLRISSCYLIETGFCECDIKWSTTDLFFCGCEVYPIFVEYDFLVYAYFYFFDKHGLGWIICKVILVKFKLINKIH